MWSQFDNCGLGAFNVVPVLVNVCRRTAEFSNLAQVSEFTIALLSLSPEYILKPLQ